jgi:hypothetical protein
VHRRGFVVDFAPKKFFPKGKKKYCNPICLCYIARHTLTMYYPEIRINSEGKE